MITFFKINFIAILLVFSMSAKAIASLETNGEAGINSDSVPYTGSGISIGQVELQRPGKFGFDNGSNSNFGTIPKEVFLLDNRVGPTANAQAEIFDLSEPTPDAHATKVAGVIIGKAPLTPGVARDADLYATAGLFPQAPSIPTDDSFAISTQFIATIDDDGLPTNDSIDDVRAINMSFFALSETGGIGNGNSKLTQFVDWSAAKHDVLYVTSWRNSDAMSIFGQPHDNFNGLTVAASEKAVSAFDAFRKFGSSNAVNFLALENRSFIDLLAPGVDIELADAGGGTFNNTGDGSSFAAPHVTGTVALLQEFGDAQITAGAANWTGTVASGPPAVTKS